MRCSRERQLLTPNSGRSCFIGFIKFGHIPRNKSSSVQSGMDAASPNKRFPIGPKSSPRFLDATQTGSTLRRNQAKHVTPGLSGEGT